MSWIEQVPAQDHHWPPQLRTKRPRNRFRQPKSEMQRASERALRSTIKYQRALG